MFRTESVITAGQVASKLLHAQFTDTHTYSTTQTNTTTQQHVRTTRHQQR